MSDESDAGSDGWNLDATVGEAAVHEMVHACRPAWTVTGVERVEEGTDFVAVVDLAGEGAPATAVLKATTAGFVDPAVARSEPLLFEYVAAETDVPVPAVYGACGEQPELPAPFYLVEHVDGAVNAPDAVADFGEDAIRRTLREAGENLAALHELGPLPAVGQVGVRDGGLVVLDTDDEPRYDDARKEVADEFEDALDALADGTWFPERALEPQRFADLVDPVREYATETVPALPEPEAPTYCHWDYRWGNVLVDPESGATTAVLDWANLAAIEPAYNLAKLEASMLDAGDPDPETLSARRRTFRTAYADARNDWMFTPAVEERMRCYRLLDELQSMACLPLWHEDADPSERDAIEAAHRDVVAEYR